MIEVEYTSQSLPLKPSRRGIGIVVAMIVFVSAAVAVSVGPVSADFVEISDADENASALDIKFAQHRHRRQDRGKSLLVHEVETYEAWDSSLLDTESVIASLIFHFDLDGAYDAPIRALGFCGEGFERTLEVDVAPDGSLFAEMRRTHGPVYGYAKVWRPDNRTLRVSFPRRLLKRHLANYRWCVDTGYHDPSRIADDCGASDDREVFCVDRAPDRRAKNHRL